uniref:Uncharacterized protein n=1 Tax=Panagrolaimus davidi TaxID=227884 RepID=A0A914QUA6_9BILA
MEPIISYLILIINFLIFCKECFPTPQPETVICPPNPCSLTGRRFNGAGPFYGLQQPLICDEVTGQYSYTDTGGIQQPISSVVCVCGALLCNWNIMNCQIQDPVVGGPVTEADDDCNYQYEAYCTGPQTMIQFYNPNPTLIEQRPYPPGIQPVVCPAGRSGGYYFTDLSGNQQTTVRCNCV